MVGTAGDTVAGREATSRREPCEATPEDARKTSRTAWRSTSDAEGLYF